jgi:type VI secretion system secreted protein VgrG
MDSYTHANRSLSIITPLGKDAVLIECFKGREAISSLTELELEIISLPDNPVVPSKLIGERVTLVINYDTNKRRYFNGIIRSLTLIGHDTAMLDQKKLVLIYKADVVPSMWLLTLNTQTRVFQNKTVLEIVKEILSSYSISSEDNTRSTYQTLDYCTQYRETDYDFVTRILGQHGIFFYFTHTENDHKLVLADNSKALQPCPVQDKFQYAPQLFYGFGPFYKMYIGSFDVCYKLVTGKHIRWDYSFTRYSRQTGKPELSRSHSETGDNNHESYDYADGPSAWAKTEASYGKIDLVEGHLQEIARNRNDAQSQEVTGDSNAGLYSGFTFQLTDHPDEVLNTKYIVLNVEHHFRQQPPFRQVREEGDWVYRNRFTAQPATLVYSPPLTTPKPRVQGVLTGKVVAPAGKDSHLDRYGRVCVQFWWDSSRKSNQVDNTMLRVAQPWAGSERGTYFWPRAGDEVLIGFIEGDPDAPIVVGSLYNGVNTPLYDPSTEYTRSGISTKANQLWFDDRMGITQMKSEHGILLQGPGGFIQIDPSGITIMPPPKFVGVPLILPPSTATEAPPPYTEGSSQNLSADSATPGNEQTSSEALKANVDSLKNLQANFDQVNAFQQTTTNNINRLQEAAQKIPELGGPLANVRVSELSSQMPGSQNMAAFKTALNTTQADSANILHSSSTSGVLSDSSRQQLQQVVDGNTPYKSLVASLNTVHQDMKNRLNSFKQQINDIKGRITPYTGSLGMFDPNSPTDPLGISGNFVEGAVEGLFRKATSDDNG